MTDSTTVRRVQTTHRVAIDWCRRLRQFPETTPILKPVRYDRWGNVILWQGHIAPGMVTTTTVDDVLRLADAEGDDVALRAEVSFADVEIQTAGLPPLALWLLEQRPRALRYEQRGGSDRIEIRLQQTLREASPPSPALEQMYGPERFDQPVEVPLLWGTMSTGQTGTQWLIQQVRRILLRRPRELVRYCHRLQGEPGTYVVTAAEIEWAERHPDTAAERQHETDYATEIARQAAETAANNANPEMISACGIAAELGITLQEIARLRRAGLIEKAASSGGGGIWYWRRDLPRIVELISQGAHHA